jgi:hypothetical protein
MDLKFYESEDGRYMNFEGSMIYKNSRAAERFIVDMVRRQRHLKVDLSKVQEVDRCGMHLLAMIKSFGTELFEIVATSPVVDIALVYLPLSRRKHHSLRDQSMQPPISVRRNSVALSV